MTPEELVAFLKNDAKERISIVEKKNKDYATEDALSNFKRRAEIFKALRLDQIITTPVGIALKAQTYDIEASVLFIISPVLKSLFNNSIISSFLFIS